MTTTSQTIYAFKMKSTMFAKRNNWLKNLPNSIKFLVFTDMAERFSFYGLTSISILYMMSHFKFSEVDAVSIFSFFRSLGYVVQIFTIYIAARLFTQYQIILYSLIGVAIGHILIGVALNSSIGFCAGLLLIFVMTGLLKPVNMPFLIRQCGNNKKLESNVVAMNYSAFNFATIFTTLIVPFIYNKYAPKYGFMLPAIVAILAVLIIFLGRKTYVMADKTYINSKADSLFLTIKTYYRAKKEKKSWANEVMKNHGKTGLDDLKKIPIICFVWIGALFFFMAYDNLYHAMIVHCQKLDPYVFGFKIIPVQLSVINSIIPVIGVPIVRCFLLPIFFRSKSPCVSQIIKKMAFGSLITSIGYLAVVFIEFAISNNLKISATYDLIPWVLISFSEVITYVYILEFFSSYVSENNRIITSVMLTMSMFVASLLLSIFAKIYGSIDSLYFTFCVLFGLVSMFVFIVSARQVKD